MSTIEQVIVPRPRDLGGFSVRRILPHETRRMVGPFIFLDHMGPASFESGKGVDVRPHPHIGLATVTYLFDGELFHRDSLGSAIDITPGAVNWMTAGRGIVHSERTAERNGVHRLHGLQSWVALPKAYEETEPEFFHHPAASLPTIESDGVRARVVAGSVLGRTSPVKIYSPLFYLALDLEPGARIALPPDYSERAVYVVEGDLATEGETLVPLALSVLAKGRNAALEARSKVRAVALGGEPLGEERHIWWNFVSSSKARIENARRDWREGRFPKVPGDSTEFIPLPES